MYFESTKQKFYAVSLVQKPYSLLICSDKDCSEYTSGRDGCFIDPAFVIIPIIYDMPMHSGSAKALNSHRKTFTLSIYFQTPLSFFPDCRCHGIRKDPPELSTANKVKPRCIYTEGSKSPESRDETETWGGIRTDRAKNDLYDVIGQDNLMDRFWYDLLSN